MLLTRLHTTLPQEHLFGRLSVEARLPSLSQPRAIHQSNHRRQLLLPRSLPLRRHQPEAYLFTDSVEERATLAQLFARQANAWPLVHL